MRAGRTKNPAAQLPGHAPDQTPAHSPGRTLDQTPDKTEHPPVVRLCDVRLAYGATVALDGVSLHIPARKTVGFIGPDGVGKSSLLSLVAGARVIQGGTVTVLGGDMARKAHRDRVCNSIAYMPQGLGKNMYPTLSVEENLQFFAKLFGHPPAERRRRIDLLTRSTGLHPFLDRPAGKLSGGMKQKLGLCCSLIHDPALLVLDEPTMGVDPLARAQFWDLIKTVRANNPEMSVMVATAYMDEARSFDWLVAMDAGRVLATGSPAELLRRTGCDNLDEAFIRLLPESRIGGHSPVVIQPLEDGGGETAIEARGLTKKFGNFTAVNNVSFRIRQGEIFGFLGSNGCGKTTTMKVLTGLLPATAGTVRLFGREAAPGDMAARQRLGYMTQSFSLYGELTVRQNLVLHARLFHMPEADISARVEAVCARFGLTEAADALPENLPLGVRQRLSLATALIHSPEILILDEPTSGVDPVARDEFWQLLMTLSRKDKVTIFISTHFMNEAMRCDRISLMHAGTVLDSDRPQALMAKRRAATLEEAFVGYLLEAGAGAPGQDRTEQAAPEQNTLNSGRSTSGRNATDRAVVPQPQAARPALPQAALARRFSPTRCASCVWRESLELYRDPVRATLALLGSLILMAVMGCGITMDVENLRFAVLDHDQTGLSRDYALQISGSRYFTERPPLADYTDLDRRMREADISLAIEFPPNFARDLSRGGPAQVGVWLDGAMPQRAETIQGYIRAIHQEWLATQARQRAGQTLAGLASVEIRYRYNPDVKSLPAMVPAVIPLMMLMIPAMLAALSIVREKELGSILNLYTTPLTRAEFIIGKQIPYIALSMASFLLMVPMAVLVFDVPVKGSFGAFFLAAAAYSAVSTGLGMFMSSFTKSQIAVMFGTLIITMLPAIQFSGLLNSVSSLSGTGRIIGEVYPTTHMLVISRGIFNKGLSLADLYNSVAALCITIPIVTGASIALLKKQDR